MSAANDTEAFTAVADSLSRTRAVGSARVTMLRGAKDVALPATPPSFRSNGFLFPLARLAYWVVKNGARALDGEGVIDFTRQRYMIDFGGYAVLHAGGREWDGASGVRLATLPAEKQKRPGPQSLVELLDGVRAAIEIGVEPVRGTSCRHFQADVNPDHAASVLAGDWPTDLGERPVDVWIDDAHVRRIRAWVEARPQTLELWDFGLPVEELDWTRLPVFRPQA